MSVEVPKLAVNLGGVGVPQGDIVEARVHLGATKEVSSWELLLQNWDCKYGPSGAYPLSVGQDGYVCIGRGVNVPQIITTRTESVEYESAPAENYVRVSGRCWGEKLFRRVVTKTYVNQKGEAIVKDLLDYYVGLSHSRGGVELVEDTDTTYMKLEYADTPVWDILRYIAESSDEAGAIGFDFRVAADGKFEFFPQNSKSSSVSLSEKIEQSTYRRDIHRVRNKIMIYGVADKSVPLDKDLWTESLLPSDGVWTATSGVVSFDTVEKAKGTGSIKLYAQNLYYGSALFTLNAGKEVNCNLYPTLEFLAFLEKTFNGNVTIQLYDTSSREAKKNLTVAPDEWRLTSLRVGAGNESDWEEVAAGFDWTQIKQVRVSCDFSGAGTGSFWVDGLYFGGRRYAAVREDAASQSAYGLRELSETDEELWSDNECDLRAKALLAYLKDPAEYLTVSSTVIDYGSEPILPGDKIHVELPNENVDSDFRIESVEYRVDAKTQTLELTLELGKVPPQMADYLYGLRTFTVNVEKLSRTKLGKKGIPSVTQSGGVGSHHVAHEAGDDNGAVWSSVDDGGWDKIAGWITPQFVGPFSDEAAIVQFRTRDKAASAVLDHQFVPADNGHGLLGSEAKNWKEVHSAAFFLPGAGYVRCRVPGENAFMQLTKELLEFGAGGAEAPDVYLKRSAEGAFEVKADVFKPAGDNITELGSAEKRFKKLWLADLTLTSDLNVNKTAPVINIKTSDAVKAMFGFDGVNAFLSAQAGDLVFSAASGVVRPYADATYDLGNASFRWSGLYVAGVGRVGWLNIDVYTVITSGRVLQNVTADAAIITSGQFGLGRMPRGTGGYVFEAQGIGYDPVYVDPNGRYTPAGHGHAAGDITSGTIAEARLPNVYSGQVTFNGGIVTSSVNCANWQLADAVFANGFCITEAEKVGLGNGLAFLNREGKAVMVLAENGDLQLAGKVKALRVG